MEVKISFSKDLALGNPDGFYMKFNKGVDYLITRDLLKPIKKLYKLYIEKEEEVEILTTTKIQYAKNILIYRSGGIGDLLFILPYINNIKKLNNAKITFCTFNNNIPILSLNEHIDEIISDPLEYNKVLEYDHIVFFRRFIEENPIAEKVNAFDLAKDFFSGVGREAIEEGITVKSFKEASHKRVLSSKYPLKLVIQPYSSTNIRDIPDHLFVELVKYLPSDKISITFIGSIAQESNILNLIKVLRPYNPKLSITYKTNKHLEHTLIDIAQKTDLFLGPDSGLTHYAGVLGLPVVGLFGPFPSELRMRYYKNAYGLCGMVNCVFEKDPGKSGCFTHGAGKCPLSKILLTSHSPCIAAINVESILWALDRLSKKVYKLSIIDDIIEDF